MEIEKLLGEEIKVEEGFDYRKLFNDSRGAVHKDEYIRLLRDCLSNGIIKLRKYRISKDVSIMTLYDLADLSGVGYYQLKEQMKDYHQENYYHIAPFMYLLQLIEPQYKINEQRKKYEEPLLLFPTNIEVGYRFHNTNAFSRLFFTDSRIAINSYNDSIENVMDTLEIDGISVYILCIEEKEADRESIVMYKLIKGETFNDLKEETEHRFMDEIFIYRDKI